MDIISSLNIVCVYKMLPFDIVMMNIIKSFIDIEDYVNNIIFSIKICKHFFYDYQI